jgi:dTDP-L-rhamnose 4-epimerase
MPSRVLITGGGGFIGTHVAHLLLERGYKVRILDSMHEQVHGQTRPSSGIWSEVEFLIGDVRDGEKVSAALAGVDTVIHLAAEVGVGQSMYAIERYVSTNDCGTAVLFERLIATPVQRVVVASSMSIYGEGLYRDRHDALVEDAARCLEGRVNGGGWEPLDRNGDPLRPVATPEWKRPNLVSVYALTKYAQERLTMVLSAAYGIQGLALRLFNVYGPGQALSNPYTGVLAIFASRLLHGRPPVIFEDGLQRRDFIHVEDVARAFVLAIEHPNAAGGVYNVGSGRDCSIRETAERLAMAMGRPHLSPVIAGKARAGDIRHCFADVSKIHDELGFVARRDFGSGLAELAGWVDRQTPSDRLQTAHDELIERGLIA